MTEPLELVEGNEAGLQQREGLVDVGAAFVADGQAASALEYLSKYSRSPPSLALAGSMQREFSEVH